MGRYQEQSRYKVETSLDQIAAKVNHKTTSKKQNPAKMNTHVDLPQENYNDDSSSAALGIGYTSNEAESNSAIVDRQIQNHVPYTDFEDELVNANNNTVVTDDNSQFFLQRQLSKAMKQSTDKQR